MYASSSTVVFLPVPHYSLHTSFNCMHAHFLPQQSSLRSPAIRLQHSALKPFACIVYSKPTNDPKPAQHEHEHVDHAPQKGHPRAHLVIPRAVHRTQHQPDHGSCEQGLDPADEAVEEWQEGHPCEGECERARARLARRAAGARRAFRDSAGGAARARSTHDLHADGEEGDEEV